MIYSEMVRPRYADLGRDGKLSCAAVLEILETAGGHHADQAGDPLVRDAGTGAVWVLTEWRARFLRTINSQDSLLASTWLAAGSPAAMTLRGYLLTDAEGCELARAEARCALVNLSTGRLARIDKTRFDAYLPEDRPAFDLPYARLFAPESYETETVVRIRESDMDFNGHVHNTYYLSLASELCPELLTAGKGISELRIQYKKQVKECTAVTVRRSNDESGCMLGIYAQDELCTLIRVMK